MNKRTFLLKMGVCLLAFILLLGCVICLAIRPISYNMEYYGETNDEYGFFAASRYYTRNNVLFIENTNFDLPLVDYYYYKDGYAFGLRAETEEQYTEEVEKINSNWEEALKVDFYADKISAYKMTAVRPDGVETVYICRTAIVLTVIAAAAALACVGLAAVCFVRYRKAKKEEQPTEG